MTERAAPTSNRELFMQQFQTELSSHIYVALRDYYNPRHLPTTLGPVIIDTSGIVVYAASHKDAHRVYIRD